MPCCARNCCARVKAGSPKKAWTIQFAYSARVWVVDPLDGTREFVAGIPEYCVSVAMVEDGRPVAGGIYNPATNETFLGSLESGVTYNGKPAQPSQRTSLDGALVLASRSETKRGEWKPFERRCFQDSPHGFGSLQARLGLGGTGGCYVHSDSQERMGRGRGSFFGAERWRVCQHSGEHALTLQ